MVGILLYFVRTIPSTEKIENLIQYRFLVSIVYSETNKSEKYNISTDNKIFKKID